MAATIAAATDCATTAVGPDRASSIVPELSAASALDAANSYDCCRSPADASPVDLAVDDPTAEWYGRIRPPVPIAVEREHLWHSRPAASAIHPAVAGDAAAVVAAIAHADLIRADGQRYVALAHATEPAARAQSSNPATLQ